MTTQPDFDQAALELVTEFGGAGTYSKKTSGAYNPLTSTVNISTVSQPIVIAIFDLNRPNNGLGTKYGREIIDADKEAYVIPPQKTGGTPLSPIDPVNDSIEVGGVSYSIVTFKEINPSGADPILHMFYLRR